MMAIKHLFTAAFIFTSTLSAYASHSESAPAPSEGDDNFRIPAVATYLGEGYYAVTEYTLPLSGSREDFSFAEINRGRIIDTFGNIVSPWMPDYFSFRWDETRHCLVRQDEEFFYYVTPDGHLIEKSPIEEPESHLPGFDEETFKFALVDNQGKVIGPPIYDQIGPFNEGVAVAVKDWQVGVIDTCGNVVIPFIYSADVWSEDLRCVRNGLVVMYRDADHHSGVIDLKGEVVIPFIYRDIIIGSRGTIRATDYDAHINVYYDCSGKKLRSDKYLFSPDSDPDAEILPFSTSSDKCGYIAPDGTILIKPVFDAALDFNGSYAVVKINGAWHVINRTGKIVKRNLAKYMMYELAG